MKKVLFTLLAWIAFTVSMSGQLLSGVYSAMEIACGTSRFGGGFRAGIVVGTNILYRTH